MKIPVQRGAVPITLDRPRTLFFDMAATCLLAQKYGPAFIGELYVFEGKGSFKLKSADAMAVFLWAGLQAELADTDEELTQEQAAAFIRPWTFNAIFNALVLAVIGATATPEVPGKAAGAAAGPAAVPAAKRRASTSRRRSGSTAAS